MAKTREEILQELKQSQEEARARQALINEMKQYKAEDLQKEQYNESSNNTTSRRN